MKILLTTTSFQDTPGPHHDLLARSGFDVVRARGPLSEAQMLELISENDGFDAFLNGDDRISARVIDAAGEKLKVIAKYGIGLDSIDVAHASAKKIPVLFTPGVNHSTVAEHTFGLMIALAKDFWIHTSAVKNGLWTRRTGHELMGKTLGILGLGRIGQEVVKRANAFGMHCVAYSRSWPDAFASEYHVERLASAEALLPVADVVSLHLSLSDDNRGLINSRTLATMKRGAYLINTARGGLVVEEDVAQACRSGQLAGYATDVVDAEPMLPGHPFQTVDTYWPEAFASEHGVERMTSAEALLAVADVVSLHMSLSDTNRGLINSRTLALMKPGAYLINTARGGLVVEADIAEACRSGQLAGYGTDVVDAEPMTPGHPFQTIDTILVTPHISSRTFESVERQALRAVTNLVEFLNGGQDFIQANRF